jgi:oxaloacetate decarboxylase beta subunit
MPYHEKAVSQTTKILFPILITIIAGAVVPRSVSLVGFLMFGNLIRECGCSIHSLKAPKMSCANLITIFLGITIAARMQAKDFLTVETLMILGWAHCLHL